MAINIKTQTIDLGWRELIQETLIDSRAYVGYNDSATASQAGIVEFNQDQSGADRSFMRPTVDKNETQLFRQAVDSVHQAIDKKKKLSESVLEQAENLREEIVKEIDEINARNPKNQLPEAFKLNLQVTDKP